MPKNMINLNSLPLGDMPDGGLITLPGDKVTIRDRVIIYETSENGKKVVKLYRQDNGPQKIQPAPAPQQQHQQGVKRAGSTLPQKPEKKRNRGAKKGSQLTADQERRRQEISVEKKRVSEELKACAAEREAITHLRASDPNNPEIERRFGLNKKRRYEVETRARENGALRRALNSELYPNSESDGNWGGQEVEEGMMGHNNSFGQPHMQNQTTLFSEHNSDPEMFGYHGIYGSNNDGLQDQYRQSYAGAPGYQSHPPSYLQHTATQFQVNDNAGPISESKIHPSRLSLMNSNTAIPERYSTEPKVSMKVTGKNMVPLARSRLTSREAKAAVRQEQEVSEPGEIQKELSGDDNIHAKSRQPLRKDSAVVKKENVAKSSLPSMADETLKPDEVIAWLDANIPLNEDSTAGKDFSGQVYEPRMHGDQKHKEQRCASPLHTKEAHDVNIIAKLGLQHYHDDESTLDHEEPRAYQGITTAEVHHGDLNVKQEPSVDHTQTVVARDQEVEVIIKREPMTDHSSPSEQSLDKCVIVKHEPNAKFQISATEMQKENVAIKREPEEREETILHIRAATEVMKEVVECSEDISRRKQTLGERSVNTIVVRREEIAKGME